VFEAFGILVLLFMVIALFVVNARYGEPRYSARMYVLNALFGMVVFLAFTGAMMRGLRLSWIAIVFGVIFINTIQEQFCENCGARRRQPNSWNRWPTTCRICQGSKFIRLSTALKRNITDPIANAPQHQPIVFVVRAKTELDAQMIAGALRKIHNTVIDVQKKWWPVSRRWMVTALTESMPITHESTLEWARATTTLLAQYDGVLRHWAPAEPRIEEETRPPR
jgi:hypothetical protein